MPIDPGVHVSSVTFINLALSITGFILVVLGAIIAYFLKRLVDKVDKTDISLNHLSQNVANLAQSMQHNDGRLKELHDDVALTRGRVHYTFTKAAAVLKPKVEDNWRRIEKTRQEVAYRLDEIWKKIDPAHHSSPLDYLEPKECKFADAEWSLPNYVIKDFS